MSTKVSHTQAGIAQYREFIDRLFQVKVYLTNGISTEPPNDTSCDFTSIEYVVKIHYLMIGNH